MIFTPQWLVSRYNLAKLDPINIKSKQLYRPHFGIRCIVWKQSRNRLRVHVLLTSCSPGRKRAKHGDSREIKTKTSFTRVGTNSSTDCSTFCMSPQKFLHSFSIGMAFLNLLSVAFNQSCYTESRLRFTQQDGRKRRTAKRVCGKGDRTMCCRNLH